MTRAHLTLDPTDVVDVALDDGSRFRSRLTRVDVGADFVMAVKAVSQEAATYVASDIADGGSGVVPQVIAAAAATKLIFADLPLLRDVDDLGGSGLTPLLPDGRLRPRRLAGGGAVQERR